MVAMCNSDKDRFIKLLDILDYTYFGNVLQLNKFHELFESVTKLIAKAETGDSETPEAKKSDSANK